MLLQNFQVISTSLSTIVILSSLFSFSSIDVVLAKGIYRQTIQNANSTEASANDLSLVFPQPVTEALITPRGTGNAAKGVAKPPGEGELPNTTYVWAQMTFGVIKHDQMADIDFTSDCPTCSIKEGMWTIDGNDLAGVTPVGQPMLLKANSPLSITFVNSEEFSITYDNIKLFKDNEISNFNLDNFTIPTGTLVTGIPSSLTLGINESFTIKFVDFNKQPSTYLLATADVYATSSPDNVFSVATANDYGPAVCVPEPLTILGTGVVLGAIPVLKKEYAKRNKKKDEDA